MLIVLFIISLLAVVALRALPGEDQRPREAGRMLSVYISSAKYNAAATGRSTGIMLRPATNAFAGYSTVIDQCEIPPTYAGDTLDAVVRVMDWTTKLASSVEVPYDTAGRIVVKLQLRLNDFPEKLLRFGDQIQLNGQGPIYTILEDPNTLNSTTDQPSTPFPDFPETDGFIDFRVGTDSNGDNWIDTHYLTLFLNPVSVMSLPWPESHGAGMGWSNPVIFTITRQPVKSVVTPLQLPSGSGIDLHVSGVDNAYPATPHFLSTGNTTIMFSPSGAVESLNINGNLFRPTQTIHLLIGKPTVSGEPNNNYADLKNIIVSINPLTGTISTSPVYPPYFNTRLVVQPAPNPFPNTPPANLQNEFDPIKPPQPLLNNYVNPYDSSTDKTFLQSLFYSRTFAREAQTMGGKR